MKRINLLPRELLQDQSGSRLQRKHCLLAGGAALAIAAWVCVAWLQLRSLETQIAAAAGILDPLRQQNREIQQLESQFEGLRAQIESIQQMYEPASPAAILALLTRVAPDDVVLSSLSIELSAPLTCPDLEVRVAKPPRPEVQKFMQVRMNGMATADFAIADMVRRLTECGFRNVRLDDSRESIFNDHHCSLFQISMDIPIASAAAVVKAEASSQP